jgi:hypothetical protein
MGMDTDSHFHFVSRLLAQESENHSEQTPISSFFCDSAIVLLGDPGAGKTTLFKWAAAEEGAQYLTVRQFLIPEAVLTSDKPIYLDALDEVRARTEDGDSVLDRVVGKLSTIGKPKFRISCRATDWFGEHDKSHLRHVSADGTIRVLHLLPLRTEQVRELVSHQYIDIDEFMERARSKGVIDWLKNPRDLELLIKALGHGVWPESRQELFSRGCESLATEVNDSHTRSQFGEPSVDEVLNAARHICAAHMLAGTAGFSLSQSVANVDYPYLADLSKPGAYRQSLKASARRRLFRHQGSERVTPMHRSVAEYLAARYLVDRVRQDLPIGRVLALLTSCDGGVPSELRGLYAWFTCLGTEFSEALVDRDPLSIVLFGDVTTLSTSGRKRLLVALQALADRDPYFYSEHGRADAFAPFATPQLENEIRQIISDPTRPFLLTSAILEGLAVGQPLPSLGDLLLEVIRDTSRAYLVTKKAVAAFCKTCPGRIHDIRLLLDEVQAGAVDDSTDEIRHELLQMLFPGVIDCREVVDYLIPAKPGVISTYRALFLGEDFFELLPPDDLPGFLDALAAKGLPDEESDYSHSLESLVAKAIARALDRYGEVAESFRLYKWLGIPLLRFHHSILDHESKQVIGRWFETHTDVYRRLFIYAFEETEWENFSLFFWDFQERCQAGCPHAFGYLLLDLVSRVDDELTARHMIQHIVRLSSDENRQDEPSLPELLQHAEHHPHLSDIWQACLTPDPYDHRHDNIIRQIRREKQEKQIKESNCENLRKVADEIVSGENWSALSWLAKNYFNVVLEPSLGQLQPAERIEFLVGSEIAQIALEGFVASIYNPRQQSISELGMLSAQQQASGISFPVLAGMDLLWVSNREDVLQLPIETLTRALIYHISITTSGDNSARGWVDTIRAVYPVECAQALMEFWQPSLQQKIPSVTAIGKLQEWPDIGRLTSMPILKSFPRAHRQPLQELISACLVHSDHNEVLSLARCQVGNPRGLRTEQYLLWLGTAFLLEPSSFSEKLLEHSRRTVRKGSEIKRASLLKDFFSHVIEPRGDLLATMSGDAIETMIIAFTRAYPHTPIAKVGFRYGPIPEYEVEWVGFLINHLGNRSDRESFETLINLRDHPDMMPWRDRILHTIETQSRKRREAEFRQPTFIQVVETLRDGRPANASDLFALLCHYLDDLADDIGNAPSDGYKIFWNLDPYENPIQPLPENTCRDRLKERLGLLLGRLGIVVERERDHAEHKRSDLQVSCDAGSIPVECKRHGNRDLWTGIENQLIHRYTCDPACSGYGIYLVFWFGLETMDYEKQPPQDIPRPNSAAELEIALESLIPEGYQNNIRVICIDVTRRQITGDG